MTEAEQNSCSRGVRSPIIAAMIDHKLHSITSRYVHCADAALLLDADKVAMETMKRIKRSSPPARQRSNANTAAMEERLYVA
jgi:hypothetical protein